MASIKKLAGQTAIYGLPTILGRLLNYLLVPLQTYVFLPEEYGVVGEMYAWMSLLLVILTYGMETAYFRFSQQEEYKKRVYGTAIFSLLTTSLLFLAGCCFFSNDLAALLKYENHPEYIRYIAIIISIDAFTSISFAHLRLQMRAMRFAIVKFANIGVNILLNLFFLALCPYLHTNGIATEWLGYVYQPEIGVGYVFIANVAASVVTLLLLLPMIFKMEGTFSWQLWKKMMVYALPLLVFGLAGIVNETMDRILLKNLSPAAIAQSEVGIYSACYKISIMMTIFIQAFKYAAEPFFFTKSKDKDAKENYAQVMTFFVLACSVIFAGIMLYLDIIQYFVGEEYRVGMAVVPILLLANLFLGIFYNLSIWYKLTNQTKFGAYIALIGAAITLILNYLLIPRIGYMGAAWATFACYFTMMILSYILGQKHFPVNYNIAKILYYIIFAVAVYGLSVLVNERLLGSPELPIKLTVNSCILVIYITILCFTERKLFIEEFRKQ